MANKLKVDSTGEAGMNTYPQSNTGGVMVNAPGQAARKSPLDWYIRDYARQIEACALKIVELNERERSRDIELELHGQHALLNGLLAGLRATLEATN
ncbi:MAG TPA: hypothetical protein PKD55_24110 [Bellilinea sp.]|nr:hypothetical protein [Bellilinea sp.]